MEQYKSYKFRLYPNKEQAHQIDTTLGCCRFIYNHMLDRNIKIYKRRGEHLGDYDMANLLPQMKKYLPWLAKADGKALRSACTQVDTAYKKFFKKESGFPAFKSKHNHNNSYTTRSVQSIYANDTHIKLPKLGFVRYANSREIGGKIVSVTVRKTPTGKYFVAVLCKVDIQPIPATDSIIGINIGIRNFENFASDSNGNSISNPQYLIAAEKKLKREQRKLSRKTKNSHNYEKQRRKLAKQYENIVNLRTNFLHTYSTTLVKENQIICVEDMNIQKIMCNHKWAKYITDASWGEFIRQLSYKAEWYGRTLIKVPMGSESPENKITADIILKKGLEQLQTA